MIPRGPLIAVATGALSAFAYGGGAARDQAPVAVGTATSARDTGSGAIAGKVFVEAHKDGLERQPVKVKDGALADVLVYVKSGIGAPYSAPVEPFLLDQIGCEYHPSMVVVMVGQPLRIRNSDDTLHNIHPRPTINKEFNIGQPRKGMEVTRTFDKAELMIPTGCEVHPWMRAYISVLAHPFFSLTKEDGSYEIKALPDGEYDVEAIHSQLKSATGKVIVKGGRTSRLDLSLKS